MSKLDNVYADSLEKIQMEAEKNAKYYREEAKREMRDAKERMKKVADKISVARVLVAAGVMTVEQVVPFATCPRSWSEDNKINVTGKRHSLETLYGTDFIELDYDSLSEESAKDKTVRVPLKQSVDYIGPQMYVVQPLPEDAKCQYKTSSYTSTSTNLVCNRD